MRKNLNRSAFTWLCIIFLLSLYGIETGKSNSPGDLSMSHYKPGSMKCSICHSVPGEADPVKCLDCHKEIASRIRGKRGYHRDKAEDCGTCHTEHQGRKAKIIELDEKDFDHSETGFELKGSHSRIDKCRKCHSPELTVGRKNFTGYLYLKSGCITCHEPPHPGINDNCTSCHDEISWTVDNWRR